MSQNERDTHFAGFAKLVWTEIHDEIGAYLEQNLFVPPEAVKAIETLIAQRAYDLACHTFYETSYGLDRFFIQDRINENVPDLTALPDHEPPGDQQ